MFKEAHVRVADMVRYVDGEGSTRFREKIERHLDRCSDCNHQLGQLRQTSRTLDQHLALLDFSTAADVLPASLGDIRATSSRLSHAAFPWQKAAVITLLVGAAAVASPARARIAEWLRAMTGSTAGNTEIVQAPRPAPARAAGTSALYRFAPADEELIIEFAAMEAAGVLLVRRTSDTSAQFEVTPGATSLPVLILPTTVRVTNEAAGSATYRLLIPDDVQRVTVRAGPRTIATLAASSLRSDEDVRLTLTRN